MNKKRSSNHRVRPYENKELLEQDDVFQKKDGQHESGSKVKRCCLNNLPVIIICIILMLSGIGLGIGLFFVFQFVETTYIYTQLNNAADTQIGSLQRVLDNTVKEITNLSALFSLFGNNITYPQVRTNWTNFTNF
jgi:hypothetical protein